MPCANLRHRGEKGGPGQHTAGMINCRVESPGGGRGGGGEDERGRTAGTAVPIIVANAALGCDDVDVAAAGRLKTSFLPFPPALRQKLSCKLFARDRDAEIRTAELAETRRWIAFD